jgi:hypothetical protein
MGKQNDELCVAQPQLLLLDEARKTTDSLLEFTSYYTLTVL